MHREQFRGELHTRAQYPRAVLLVRVLLLLVLVLRVLVLLVSCEKKKKKKKKNEARISVLFAGDCRVPAVAATFFWLESCFFVLGSWCFGCCCMAHFVTKSRNKMPNHKKAKSPSPPRRTRRTSKVRANSNSICSPQKKVTLPSPRRKHESTQSKSKSTLKPKPKLAGGMAGLNFSQIAQVRNDSQYLMFLEQFEMWMLQHGINTEMSHECIPMSAEIPTGICLDAPARLPARRPDDGYVTLSLQEDASLGGVSCMFVVPPPSNDDPSHAANRAIGMALKQSEDLVGIVKRTGSAAARAVSRAIIGDSRGMINVQTIKINGHDMRGGFLAVKLAPNARPFERGMALWAQTAPPPPRALWSWTLQLVHLLCAVDAATREATGAAATTRFCWDAHTSLQIVLPDDLAVTSFAPALYNAFFNACVPDDVRRRYLMCNYYSTVSGALQDKTESIDMASLIAPTSFAPIPIPAPAPAPTSPIDVPSMYGLVKVAGLWGLAADADATRGSSAIEVLRWACTAMSNAISVVSCASTFKTDAAFETWRIAACNEWRAAVSALLGTTAATWAHGVHAFASKAVAAMEMLKLPSDASSRAFRAIKSATRDEALVWRDKLENRAFVKDATRIAEEIEKAENIADEARRKSDRKARQEHDLKARFKANARQAEKDALRTNELREEIRQKLEAVLVQSANGYVGRGGMYDNDIERLGYADYLQTAKEIKNRVPPLFRTEFMYITDEKGNDLSRWVVTRAEFERVVNAAVEERDNAFIVNSDEYIKRLAAEAEDKRRIADDKRLQQVSTWGDDL